MQFIINKETLAAPLQIISGLVDRKQTLPIIGNILLDIRNNQLSLTSTNLEVELRSQQPLSIDAPDIRTTIPARKLNDIVKALPNESIIECKLSDDQLSLHTDSTDFDLTVMPAEEFPLMRDTAIQTENVSLSVNQSDFIQVIEKTAFAMAIQDVRYFLNGLLLEIDGKSLNVVATDGHRLATSTMILDQEKSEKSIIIPRKGVAELTRIMDDDNSFLELEIQGNALRAKNKKVELRCKLVDGEYPNYAQVIPQNPQSFFQVEKESFFSALERTAIVLNERPKGTKFFLEPGKVTLQTLNALGERAKETVSVEYQGPPVHLGFNTEYLMEAFSKIKTKKTQISFNDPNESCLIEEIDGDRSRFVIMSMKI